MLKLNKMGIDEFSSYMEESIAHYAEELVSSGAYKSEDSLKVSQETFNRFLPEGIDTKGHNVMNIINDNNEKIGYIWYGPKGSQDSDEVFIYDFQIYEEFRGQGFGSKSMELVEEEAKKNNIKKISLHVFGHNKRAIGLYEKMGYEAYSINMSKEIG